MKLVVVILILTLIRAEDNLDVNIINEQHIYYKEILFENLPSDYINFQGSLAVDYNTNDLYATTFDYRLAIFNINTREHKYITDTKYPYCVTVDQVSHDVFIGTYNEICKYSNGTDAVENIGANDESIQSIYYYNGVLYYSRWNCSDIRILDHGQSVSFHNFNFTIWNFVIDIKGNIISQTYEGSLYKYKKSTGHTVSYEGIPPVKSLTTDRNGNVYFSVENGIYEIKRDEVERVVSVNNTRYITFDNENHLIYYNDKELKLYRLKSITNGTNNCSDRHTSVQEREDTNNNDVRTELETLNEKVDNLTQIITLLLTNIQEKQLPHVDYPKTIHIDNIVLKNINISIGLDEAGVTQTVQIPPV